jgi:hypothetical protein
MYGNSTVRPGDVAQMAENLTGNSETLGSIPSTAKKNRNSTMKPLCTINILLKKKLKRLTKNKERKRGRGRKKERKVEGKKTQLELGIVFMPVIPAFGRLR